MVMLPLTIMCSSVATLVHWSTYAHVSLWTRNASQVMYLIISFIGSTTVNTNTRFPWTKILLERVLFALIAVSWCLMSMTWATERIGNYRLTCIDLFASICGVFYMIALYGRYFGTNNTRRPSNDALQMH